MQICNVADIDRPEEQAMWNRRLPAEQWANADAVFAGQNEAEDGRWNYRKPLPDAVLSDYLQFCQGHWDPNMSEGRKALVPAQRVVAAVPDFSWGWA